MDAILDVYFCNICNDIISFQDMNSKDRKEDQSKCSKCSNRNYFNSLWFAVFTPRLWTRTLYDFCYHFFAIENTVLKSKIKIYPNYTKSANFSISNTIENQAANQWNNKRYYDWSLFETFSARKSKSFWITRVRCTRTCENQFWIQRVN